MLTIDRLEAEVQAYRNDRDKWRNRVKFLEAENARLREELEKEQRRMDWLERWRMPCEPRSDWNAVKQVWQWIWMGRVFETLRAAIDAAKEQKA